MYNATMIHSAKAAGVKLYPLSSCYGTAIVTNVILSGCDYASQIQSWCDGTSAV